MQISVNFLIDKTSTFQENRCIVLAAVKAMVGMSAPQLNKTPH